MMYQRFSDRMAYSEGHFIDLPNRSRFVSLRYSLLELQDNLKVLSRKLSLKATKAFLAVLGNPINNFCTEYQVDGEGVYRCSFSLKDFKRVRDYSRRKYFAVTVASVTIIAIMFSFIFPGQPIGRAASYFWTQTDWSGGPDSLYPNHAANQTNWAKYSSKDANVATGYAADGGTAGQAKLSAQSGSYAETSDTDFNETNLVGEWAMDEGTGSYANDTSGNGNTGTHYGKSLSFDGGDVVNVPWNSSLNLGVNQSVEVWVKYTSDSFQNLLIYASANPNYADFNIYTGVLMGKITYSVGAGGVAPKITSSSSVNDNRWHQIVGTYDGANLRLYVDGIPDATPVATSITPSYVADGSQHPYFGSSYSGSLDEVRLYNRTLSPTEISEHYQGIFTNNTSLKGLWHFKEGTGQTVADDSGLGNNGTLGADATVATDDPTWQTDAPAMWNTSGKFGGSLNFDGLNDYVLANDAFYSNSLTVSAWIKPNASSVSAAVKGIITKRNGSASEWALGLNLGKPQFYAFNSVPAAIFSAMGNTTLTAGTWYHITGTYDGTTANIYINGVADNTPVTAAGTIADTNSTIEIGSVVLNSGRFFDGLIDDVRIYNTALTQSQIQAVMANAKGKADIIISGTGSAAGITLVSFPSQVTGLAGTIGNTALTLNWSAPASNGRAIASYKVYRGATSGGETLLTTGGCSGLGAVLTCTDTGLTNGTTYYYKVSAVNAIGEGSQSAEANAAPNPCGAPIPDFTFNGFSYNQVSVGAQCWLDRNLGASRVATSSTDSSAYGYLYQWGRLTDGHQIPTSGTTPILSSTDVPNNGNFIYNTSSPYDWRSPQNNNLWQGVNGINNPCPSGYRLPTQSEWSTLVSAAGITNAATAYSSALKLTLAGNRSYANAVVGNQGSFAVYYSSSTSGLFAYRFIFDLSSANPADFDYRAGGESVRCLKN